MMKCNIREAVKRFLTEHNTMSLATSDGSFPCAASLFYASDGFVIYFLSKPESQHAINIGRRPGVAVTINRDYTDWREIKGLQITGKAYAVEPEERGKAMAIYERKHPCLYEIFANREHLIGAPDVKLYKVLPERVRLIDNRVHFGYKAEFRL